MPKNKTLFIEHRIDVNGVSIRNNARESLHIDPANNFIFKDGVLYVYGLEEVNDAAIAIGRQRSLSGAAGAGGTSGLQLISKVPVLTDNYSLINIMDEGMVHMCGIFLQIGKSWCQRRVTKMEMPYGGCWIKYERDIIINRGYINIKYV